MKNIPLHRFDTGPSRQKVMTPSVSDQLLPTSDKYYRRLGMVILLFAFGGFGGWALTADLAVAVVATGAVSVESFKKTIQHLEGGIVEEIWVQDGDQVEAGNTLLVLDKTRVLSQLQIARMQYLTSGVARVRLLAEQRGARSIEFSEALRNSRFPRVKEVLAVQKALFQARREALAETLHGFDEQISQMKEQIDGLQSMIKVSQSMAASLRVEAKDLRRLFKEGFVSNQRLRELERKILGIQGEIAQYRSEIVRLQSRISENQTQKRLEQQEFQKEVGEQLRQAQASIADAEERMTALEEQIKRTTITAPVTGTVVGMAVHTLGAVIRPGEPVLSIVPSGGDFVVEARIPDRDIDNIYTGQYAEIRFSAFNQRLTDVIEGKVVHISADAFEDEITGERYYKARIKVTATGEKNMNRNIQLLAGMPAEVMIRTGERTFASYVAKPIADMLARAMREE
ncbi:HlyD family type I secretion periplasmic adaptor subunit [Nitrosococcus watsonii]|uniref:Membrane fusion protein (MFP) family protein n=1 Tax=Nitrosococcus watsoni (strain C-113) TaxID=105559 RepID=D8K5P5_NITWC|nr:HlyD family type I secretion periplasmic adaptor subunit [Nitrosococcus watsonii]ADJ28222.1 type I secretion membrane fusion protein, HlyD family [Nitrosococcus watsonii C-113]